jgi:Rod binding domain-containing protein
MNTIACYNIRAVKNFADPEIHKTKEARALKESCQQFESIFIAEIWKKMGSLSRKISGKEDKDRPFAQMEDLALEMSAEELSKSGGIGLWKMLYEELIPQLETDLKKSERVMRKIEG